jgi:hypothetical protein
MHTAGRLIFVCAAMAALNACGGTSGAPLLVSTAPPLGTEDSPPAAAPNPQCLPLADPSPSSVRSDLAVTGSCHFTDHSAAKCVQRPGDYYVYIRHDLPADGQYVLTINVEGYKGAGTYKGGQVNVQITRSGLFYYWSTFSAAVTIMDSLTTADVSKAALAAQAGTPARGTVNVSGHVSCPDIS